MFATEDDSCDSAIEMDFRSHMVEHHDPHNLSEIAWLTWCQLT